MKKLRKKLKEAGMKQKELAARCGINPRIVSTHAVNGIKTVRVAKRYAAVLDCEPVDLLDI